jgi:3',5'-cyclic AMP phosphodiesterase CpdA
MRIAQISDFHFTHITWNPFRLFSKRILGNLNWLLSRRNAFSADQLDSLPELFRSLNVDLVLLGGDFTTTALPEEFETSARFVRKITQPWIAIPGNHDHYTYRSYRQKHFYRYFTNQKKEIAHSVDFFTLKDQGIEAHLITAGWWVVALDVSRATNLYSSKGCFSEKIEAYLEEVLSLIPKTDSVLLFSHYPFFQNGKPRHNLERGEALEEFVKRHPQIRLFLHGHTHRQTIADLQPNQLPIVLDAGSAAQGANGSWNLIDLSPDQCVVEAYRWDGVWKKGQREEMKWKRA